MVTHHAAMTHRCVIGSATVMADTRVNVRNDACDDLSLLLFFGRERGERRERRGQNPFLRHKRHCPSVPSVPAPNRKTVPA